MKPLITTVEVSIKSKSDIYLRPILPYRLQHLRRILSRRLAIPQLSSDDEPEEASVVEAFHKPALELGAALLQSMQVIEEQVIVCYHTSLSPAPNQKPDIAAFQKRLTQAVNVAREHLQEICDDLDAQKRMSSGDVHLPSKVFDSCACMIFLLQVS